MKVLVTRAERAARKTAARLEKAGHRPVVLPLVEYRDTGAQIPAGPYSGIIFTSAAAAETFRNRNDPHAESLLPGTAYCVGEATATAARSAGFADIVSGGSNAEALAAALVRRIGGGDVRPWLYLAARDRAFELEPVLAAHAIAMQTVEIYAAELVDPGRARLEAALGQCSGGAVLLYSRRTADHLLALGEAHGVMRHFDRLTFLAISRNVAEAVPGGHNLKIAARPDEEALIELLGEIDQGCEAFPGNENGKGK